MKNRTKISKKLTNFYRVALIILAAAGVLMFFFLKREAGQKYATVRLETDFNSVETQETFPLRLFLESPVDIDKADLVLTFDPKLIEVEEVSAFSDKNGKPKIDKKRGSLKIRETILSKKTALTVLFVSKKAKAATEIRLSPDKSGLFYEGINILAKNPEFVAITVK